MVSHISWLFSFSHSKLFRRLFPGVLTDIQAFFDINDADGGLIQSVFMVFFMFGSPVFGFLGDRSVEENDW